MHLAVRGHPLHTRALTVTLRQRADARLDVHGSVLDLRKRGFVPVGGDLQGPGIIHHMLLDAVVDPAAATLETITAAQPLVAFEPSAATGGESCRDPIRAVEALAGARLDAGFARRVGAAMGGPRACSHLMTLAHLLGSTTAWALAREREAGSSPRPPGQRVLRRDLVLDGHEREDGAVELAVQLTELHFAPAPALAPPMDRFARELEIRALAEVERPTLRLVGLRAAERHRDRADLARAAWQDRAPAVGGLVGLRLGPGITGELTRRLDGSPADAPLRDALLMLAPALVQCAAALSEDWPVAFAADPSVVGMGGLPDSCWMWRREGGLARHLGAGPPR